MMPWAWNICIAKCFLSFLLIEFSTLLITSGNELKLSANNQMIIPALWYFPPGGATASKVLVRTPEYYPGDSWQTIRVAFKPLL